MTSVIHFTLDIVDTANNLVFLETDWYHTIYPLNNSKPSATLATCSLVFRAPSLPSYQALICK